MQKKKQKNTLDSKKIEEVASIEHIFLEWELWSQCYGKVLVINGVSSSGKTTLSKELTKFGFHHISLDDSITHVLYSEAQIIVPYIKNVRLLTKVDVLDIIFGSPQLGKKYTEKQFQEVHSIEYEISLIDKCSERIEEKAWYEKYIIHMFEEAKKYVFRGENVIIDTVMTYQVDISKFLHFFNYAHRNILLYTPLEQNIANCFSRPLEDYRYPRQIIKQFMAIYQSNPNGQQGMRLNREEILNSLEYVTDHLKERFSFFTEEKFRSNMRQGNS